MSTASQKSLTEYMKPYWKYPVKVPFNWSSNSSVLLFITVAFSHIGVKMVKQPRAL